MADRLDLTSDVEFASQLLSSWCCEDPLNPRLDRPDVCRALVDEPRLRRELDLFVLGLVDCHDAQSSQRSRVVDVYAGRGDLADSGLTIPQALNGLGVHERRVGLGYRLGDMHAAEGVGNAVEDRRELGVRAVLGVPAERPGQGADDVQVARVPLKRVAT